MNKDKMELEEAIKKLELMEYKYTLTNNDDKAIETVLQELERLNTDNQRLKDYLSEQGMISDYLKFRKRKV